MANAIENLTPQILANILSVLRETCVLPNLVNNSYSSDAAAQGSTIDINDLNDMTDDELSVALAAKDVLFALDSVSAKAAAATPPACQSSPPPPRSSSPARPPS